MKKNILRSKQKGALPIGAIIGVAIVGSIFFVAIQLGPIYWDHANVKENIKESVRFVFIRYQRKQEERLKGEVLGTLNGVGADYEPVKENVKVKVDVKKKSASVEVWYTRSHSVPFMQNPIQFSVSADSTEMSE